MEKIPVTNPFFNAPVYYLPETDSTMSDAARIAADNPKSGTIITAGYQRRGRGRVAERRWLSAPGENLLFTLILNSGDIPAGPAGLSLRCGLGLSSCLESVYGLSPRIKWPNDLLVGGSKIAGILCQGRGSRFFIGMGINLLPPGGTEADDTFRRRPISLQEACGCRETPRSFLEQLLSRLKDALTVENWAAEVSNRLYGTGEEVAVTEGTAAAERTYTATIAGIEKDGGLILEIPAQGRHTMYAGEITAYKSEQAL